MTMPPDKLRVRSEHLQTEYELASDLVSMPREAIGSADDIVMDSSQLDCAIVRRQPGPDETSPAAGSQPVYRAVESGSFVIPTGRLFVRLLSNDRIDASEDALRAMGLEIDRRIDWAPNAAWVKRRDRDIAGALNEIGAVADRLGASVEPELVGLSARKTSIR